MFDNVCIVGVGLIGGSFGMAMRERGLARSVTGVVRREATIEEAKARGAVDEATTDLGEGARGADLIFMAPPVGQMSALCRQMAPFVRADAIVTDAGSTKAAFVDSCARALGEKAYFVGGHPMAGGEKTGVEAAKSTLFEGAVWVLTPTAGTPPPVVNTLVEMIEALGATPLLLDAHIHDELLAITSHLPHLTAAALVHLFTRASARSDVTQQLIAGGWRDATRVASGSPEMWRDICLANAPAISDGLDELLSELHALRALIRDGDGDRLHDWFEAASIARRKQGYFPR